MKSRISAYFINHEITHIRLLHQHHRYMTSYFMSSRLGVSGIKFLPMSVCPSEFVFGPITLVILLIASIPLSFKVILHQSWVKKCFPWKFNFEYGGTFTKLFMHVSSRNMFPTIRNLQIRVHVYRPRHCCGDWLTFGCFVPMIADHDLVTKR